VPFEPGRAEAVVIQRCPASRLIDCVAAPWARGDTVINPFMRYVRHRQFVRFTALFLFMICAGCDLWPAHRHATIRHDPETAIGKSPLPVAAPSPHPLDFADSNEETHVRPLVSSATQPTPVTSAEGPEALSTAEKSALDAAARKDVRVAAVLGSRAAFIDADFLGTDGKLDLGCCKTASGRRPVLLTYYSYANNIAVQVIMKNDVVAAVDRREGYVPAEGDEEIRAAIDLARRDARLGGRVQGLDGHALLMEPERGVIWNDAGYGHRVMWVTFERGTSGDPLFWALVDLSDQRVLEAGEEPRR